MPTLNPYPAQVKRLPEPSPRLRVSMTRSFHHHFGAPSAPLVFRETRRRAAGRVVWVVTCPLSGSTVEATDDPPTILRATSGPARAVRPTALLTPYIREQLRVLFMTHLGVPRSPLNIRDNGRKATGTGPIWILTDHATGARVDAVFRSSRAVALRIRPADCRRYPGETSLCPRPTRPRTSRSTSSAPSPSSGGEST